MVAMAHNGPPQPLVIENGREYHSFMKGLYAYPCDEREKDRLDLFHQFFKVARMNRLHQATFVANSPQTRILDLGTGTGIWAIDVADQNPASWVVGVDLSVIQPATIPPNLRFRAPFDYVDSPWSLGEGSFDLIHLRMGAGSVGSWQHLYYNIFNHLKPGYGSFEQIEIDLTPRCDDGTLRSDSWLKKWYSYIAEASKRLDRPLAYDHNTGSYLRERGFVDVRETIIRVPLNSWSRVQHEKDMGRWYNLGLIQGLEALTMGPMTRAYNWKKDDVNNLISWVQGEISNKTIHAYNNIHIWTARRPQSVNQ